jgi:hypothetical protein
MKKIYTNKGEGYCKNCRNWRTSVSVKICLPFTHSPVSETSPYHVKIFRIRWIFESKFGRENLYSGYNSNVLEFPSVVCWPFPEIQGALFDKSGWTAQSGYPVKWYPIAVKESNLSGGLCRDTKTREGGASKMQSKLDALAEGFDVILATPESVLVSQHRPNAEGSISILKCLKLTIDIIFQSHFLAHLTRSNARDHANPDSGPATTSWNTNTGCDVMSCDTHLRLRHDVTFDGIVQTIPGSICIGFSVDFTLNVLLAFRNYLW